MIRKLINEDESIKDYVVDGIQILALIVTVIIIMYCVDSLLNYYK